MPEIATRQHHEMRRTIARLLVRAPLWRWGIVLTLVIVGALPLLPPADAGPDAALPAFSATRAMDHVRQLAGEPRPIGSPGNARAREYIAAELTALGLEPQQQEIRVPDYFTPSGRMVASNEPARED